MIIYLKRLKSSKFVRVKAFPMYGGIGVSAPSLHRESTDSLIQYYFDCDSVDSLPNVGFQINKMTFELSGPEYVVNVSFILQTCDIPVCTIIIKSLNTCHTSNSSHP